MRRHQLTGSVLCLGVVLAGSPLGSSTGTAISGAAPATIEGEVRDSRGQPVAGASVIALPERGGAAMRTSADQDGHFRLDASPQQGYRVDVTLPGFDGWRQNHVRVDSDGGTPFRAVLSV